MEIVAVLAETNGSTTPRIAAARHIGTGQQRTGLVGALEETLSQIVKPALDNRLAVRAAIFPAIALVLVLALVIEAWAVRAVDWARVIVVEAEVWEAETEVAVEQIA